MITWSEKFATGSPLVDAQHKILFEKINDLEKLLSGPAPSKSSCDQLLEFLGSYAVSHFKFEEQCMALHKCPTHEQNKEAHAAFLSAFAKFKERYLAEGPKPELLKNLQAMAGEWIQHHILSVDLKLRDCLPK